MLRDTTITKNWHPNWALEVAAMPILIMTGLSTGFYPLYCLTGRN